MSLSLVCPCSVSVCILSSVSVSESGCLVAEQHSAAWHLGRSHCGLLAFSEVSCCCITLFFLFPPSCCYSPLFLIISRSVYNLSLPMNQARLLACSERLEQVSLGQQSLKTFCSATPFIGEAVKLIKGPTLIININQLTYIHLSSTVLNQCNVKWC